MQTSEALLIRAAAHCLDIIRQQLMCTVDIGVLGLIYYHNATTGEPTPFVDFNTKHTCRNYDAVRQWAEDHQVPEIFPTSTLEDPDLNGIIYDEIP